MVLRIAAGAAVAHADVEPAVGAELELAAVVVRVRLLDEEQLPQALASRPLPFDRYSTTRVLPFRSV